MSSSSEDLPAEWLLPHVISAFPETHVINTPQGENVTLQREVYVTGHEQDDLPPKMLAQLLALVDANLGQMYGEFAGEIYTGLSRRKRPPWPAAQWHPRKMQEMRIPELVYVVYHDATATASADTETQPLAFVSLLLTHEPEMGPHANVVYLYEVHVAHVIQRCGVGTWLLRDCAGALVRALGVWVDGFCGLELTVFRANTHALRLYQDRLGMQTAPWFVSCETERDEPDKSDKPVAARLRRPRQRDTRPAYCVLFWDARH
ncbi:LAFA_0F08064g1_1 [Lachancea sp. 'fantastica']|nr:LAFA_0F08064g1_1 [Lachancea sp. 'fantastica']